MAFAFIQARTINFSGGAGQVNSFASFTNTAGNILILVAREGRAPGTDRISTVTDSNTNVWTQVLLNNVGQGSLWYAANCNSGPNIVTVTNTNTGTHLQSVVAEYSGVATVNPFDVAANLATGVGITATSLSFSTSKDSELLIGFGSNGTTNTPGITAGSGYNLRANVNCFIEDSTAGPAGSYTASVTYSGSVSWVQWAAAFLPAVSGSNQRTLVGAGT